MSYCAGLRKWIAIRTTAFLGRNFRPRPGPCSDHEAQDHLSQLGGSRIPRRDCLLRKPTTWTRRGFRLQGEAGNPNDRPATESLSIRDSRYSRSPDSSLPLLHLLPRFEDADFHPGGVPSIARSQGVAVPRLIRMKLLHTADWHLGDRLGRIDRTDDLRRAVDRVADLCRDERVDVLLVAGDLFSELARPDGLREAIRHWRDRFREFLEGG